MKPGRAYIIIWLDHRDGDGSSHAWHRVSELDSPSVPIRTVGYAVKVTRRDVLIAHTMDDLNTESEPESTTPFTIVRKAIVSCVEIPLTPIPQEFLPTKKEKARP